MARRPQRALHHVKQLSLGGGGIGSQAHELAGNGSGEHTSRPRRLRHEGSRQRHREQKRSKVQLPLQRETAPQVICKTAKHLVRGTTLRVRHEREEGVNNRHKNRTRPVLQAMEDLSQESGEARKCKDGIRQAQRRLQPRLERNEKLIVHILPRPVLLEEPEKGLEHPTTTRRVGTKAKAIGAGIIIDARMVRAKRDLEVVGTELVHSVGSDSGHQARRRGRELQDPQEHLLENGPRCAKEREHRDHDVRHVKSRRAGPEAHLQEVGILTKLPAGLLGLVLARDRRRRHHRCRGRRRMLEPVRKLLDEQLLLCQARLEAGHVTAIDRAGGKVGSRRRRRTAAGAEKTELICLATVHLLRRQQQGHEVRRARGEDIRRRRRRAQLGSQPNRRGGRRRASRRLSTGLEEGITATTVMMTTGQPFATVRIWA